MVKIKAVNGTDPSSSRSSSLPERKEATLAFIDKDHTL